MVLGAAAPVLDPQSILDRKHQCPAWLQESASLLQMQMKWRARIPRRHLEIELRVFEHPDYADHVELSPLERIVGKVLDVRAMPTPIRQISQTRPEASQATLGPFDDRQGARVLRD